MSMSYPDTPPCTQYEGGLAWDTVDEDTSFPVHIARLGTTRIGEVEESSDGRVYATIYDLPGDLLTDDIELCSNGTPFSIAEAKTAVELISRLSMFGENLAD